jgi:hydrogenase maturation protease
LGNQERVSGQTTSTVGNWQPELERIFTSPSPAKKVVLVGMGHPLCSDDFAGSYVVKKIIVQTKHKLSEGVYLFDGEDNVEALITRIADVEAEHVVFVDACELKAEPGETRLISVTQTSYPFFTTHGVPLKLLAEQLLPKSQVWILAIQPKRTDFGEHLSPEIRAAADSVSNFLATILKKREQRVDN